MSKSNKLGQLVCVENAKNTGYGSCFEDWKQILGAFLFDSPRTFTSSELATLEVSLLAAAANPLKSKRMFPMHGFVAPTDGSEKVIIETFDYGPKAIVRDGDNDWTFQFVDGGNCLQQALRSHNGKKYALFYDKENKILGYNNQNQLSAIPLQFFYAHPWGLATGSKTASYMVQFVMLSKYTNDNRAFVKAEFECSEITGLQDIDIVVNIFNQNTGVVNATLQVACGAENVYDLYVSNLSAASFTATDQDGNNIAVLALGHVPSSKTFNITLDATAFPEGGTVILSGVSITTLQAQGIIGFEIGSVNMATAGSFDSL